MGFEAGEYFGSDEQQAMMRRAADMWTVIGGDPELGTYGRSVAVLPQTTNGLARQIAMTRLIGAAACDDLPNAQADEWIAGLHAAGLKTDRYEVWLTRDDALETAAAALKSRPLPSDLTLVRVTPETPAEDLRALSEMMMDECGVLLPNGRVMRGIQCQSVCLFARDASGNPVASAASVAPFKPPSPHADTVWWGMLATHSSRRGEGLALHLGAASMLEMAQRHGYQRFFTGIRNGNTASETLCAKLGLYRADRCVVVAIDPSAFTAGQVTR